MLVPSAIGCQCPGLSVLVKIHYSMQCLTTGAFCLLFGGSVCGADAVSLPSGSADCSDALVRILLRVLPVVDVCDFPWFVCNSA